MKISLGILLGSTYLTRRQAFSPLSLFASGEQGAWYDPSDLTTMFQDTAGTTPVTATGQTVGLLLDKSKGLVLGPERVTNGDFSGGSTGWALDAGWAVSGGAAVGTSTSGIIYQNAGTVSGRFYQVTFDILTNTSGSLIVVLAGSSIATVNGVGRKTVIGAAGASQNITGIRGFGNFTGTIDNISVKELPGNHATQATAASRPIYGIEPFGGRRNIYINTNDLTNLTNWPTGSILNATRSGAGVSVTTNEGYAYIAPSGRPPVVSGVTYTFSATIVCDQNINNVPIRFGGDYGVNAFALVNMSAGVPQRVSLTATATSSGFSNAEFGIDARNAVVPGGSNATGYVVTFSDPQFEVGSTATDYQRVTDQWNVTQAGVPSVSYLAFDGTDDWFISPTITPGTDKAQVFAGVRKLSDAAAGVIAETTTDAVTDAGLAVIASAIAGGVNQFSWGVAAGAYIEAYRTYTSPDTKVISASLDSNSAPKVATRLNGSVVSASSVTGPGVASNFVNSPLYIGRRGGTTLPFNGRIYQMLVRFGANLSAATITQTENYTAGKTGIYTLAQLNRISALTSAGTSYSAYAASDSSGNNYRVTATVLSSNGTSYQV